jgi:chemotaxis protein MotA
VFPLIGIVIVIAAVFGGYMMHHGKLAVLVQPSEFLIIWGSALGALVIGTPLPILIRMLKGFGKIMAGGRYSKSLYLDTLKMLNELFQSARKHGMMKLEADVEKPENSEIFKRYPKFLKDHHAVHFVCDTLRMAITGGVPPHDLDQLIDADLDAHHEYNAQPVAGLGIVAAVLGIVITMESLGGPPEELGKKVAAALVGTFLGVLTCYGFVGPLASAVGAADEAEAAFFRTLKAGLVAFVKGYPPIMALEVARRTIPHGERPTFQEMETECKKAKAQTAQAASSQ